VVLVAPTSTAAREATVRPIIEILGDRTKVLVEQISALDVTRLGDTIITLHGDAMWAIDDALELVLGLN
jgi:mRNA interferase MazF